MTIPEPRLFASPSTSLRSGGDGSMVLWSETALAPHPTSVAGMFRAAAAADPERVLAAQRDGDGWRTVSYAQARAAADAIGQSLLDRKRGERPLMSLCGNSIEHRLLTLGAHTVGIPVAPISVAYSQQSRDHATLRAIVGLADPGLVYADDGDTYAAAIEAVGGREVATSSGTAASQAATPLAELMGTRPTGEVERRCAEQTPDTVIKVLFTSGSTGNPKGVLTTNRMLCANQQMMRQVWPFLAEDPPVLLDWLPWSHTFGGSHNLNMVLANSGSLWIDDGRPAPGLRERTLRNLGDVSPTIYFNVPAGYAALVPALEEDAELARRFFARLRIVFFAAAALPQQLWDRIERLAARLGASAQMTTSWGATETAPAATSAHFTSGRSDRIGEDFKLSTGTWVSVGTLRPALLSAADGLLQDAVLGGHDGDYVGALAWLNLAHARRLVGAGDEADARALVGDRAVRGAVSRALERLNRDAGSSRQIARLLLLEDPPSLDAGEITDKGYINQRDTLQRRRVLVERLFADPPHRHVIRWVPENRL